MLLTNSIYHEGPRYFGVLTSSPLNRRSVRECVPTWIHNVTTYVVLRGFLSSEPGEPDKDSLFGLQKTFGSTSGECLLYYITCSYPMGEL